MPSFWLKLLAYGWPVALFFNKECPVQILVPKEVYMHGSDLYLCGLFGVVLIPLPCLGFGLGMHVQEVPIGLQFCHVDVSCCKDMCPTIG
jgi:hypothetical protein